MTTSLSCLTGFGLDVKVDQEKNWKECSEKNSKVSTKLNLKSKSVGWECLNDGVKSESRGSYSSSRDDSSTNSLEVNCVCNLGNCCIQVL